MSDSLTFERTATDSAIDTSVACGDSAGVLERACAFVPAGRVGAIVGTDRFNPLTGLRPELPPRGSRLA